MSKQRTPFDCSIASFANALGMSYEQSLQLFRLDADLHGTYAADACNVLINLGLAPVRGSPRCRMPSS